MGTSRQQTLSSIFLLLLFVSVLGCDTTAITDISSNMPNNVWTYPNKVVAVADVKEPTRRHDIYFKLRVTSEYRYSNIYVLLKMKNQAGKEVIRRYGFKLAEADGQWLGRGSGNLYAYKLGLLTDYIFPEAGRYTLSIDPTLHDNPLQGVRDVGLEVDVPKP